MSGPEDLIARKAAARAPRPLTPAGAEACADLLADAFADDPVIGYALRQNAQARVQFFRFILQRMALPADAAWIARDGSCVAIWFPPPQDAMRLSAINEIRALSVLLGAAGFSGFGRVSRLRAALARHHPEQPPHWYLAFLGVRQAFQGQGLGSAILGATLEMIDAQGLPAYLEASSAKNVPLYRRFGFETTSEFKPEARGPTISGMWRPARP